MKKIKDLNGEYLDILNSKEYKLGKYLYSLVEGMKNREFISRIKYIYMLKKLKKTKGKQERYIEIDTLDSNENKIAVYTVLFGGYDVIRNPQVISPNCDYYIITDQVVSNEKVWKKIDLTTYEMDCIDKMNVIEKNRYFKMLGINKFADYDYSIYVDANIEIYGDLRTITKYTKITSGVAMFNHSSRGCIYKEAIACKIQKKGDNSKIDKQLKEYEKAGMPRDFGMCECSIIVKDLRNDFSSKLMSLWWEDFINRRSYRDQISFPYIVWENGLTMNQIGCLGENISLDGNFRRYNHEV